ncbi:hypothetical protein H5V43_16320 [Sphingobium fuliginis]|uniref:DUF5681 domain-containing protein n=1 Tax=Sphingobium fuliginis (strain ATCC 27551) TaxID=336203 RepID=A0A7M2GFW0_SPHSA|nr:MULTISPECIES: hypothetical protein [Sphingobium]QOT71606.1 hypothetical protein H5V43_16320 [Sphingobium fuliginis]
MADSLLSPPPVPIVTKPKGAAWGPWAKMTPEERTAYAKDLAAKSAALRKPRGSPRLGKPKHLTNAQFDAAVEAQRPVVAKIMKKMAQRGELPDDSDAVEALERVLLVLRSPVPVADRTAAARVILDFTKTKPTARTESTLKTAEDYLDEMAREG